MRALVFLPLLAIAALLSNPAGADGFTRITSEETFQSLVLGKTLYLDDTQVSVAKGGAMTVVFKGKEISGTWEWADGYFCRTLTSYSNKTDCQLWESDGTDFRIARDRGNGQAFVYTLTPGSAQD